MILMSVRDQSTKSRPENQLMVQYSMKTQVNSLARFVLGTCITVQFVVLFRSTLQKHTITIVDGRGCMAFDIIKVACPPRSKQCMLQNAIGQMGSNPAHSVALIHFNKSKLFVLFDSFPNIALVLRYQILLVYRNSVQVCTFVFVQ